MGHSPQGHKELDTTERLHFFLSFFMGELKKILIVLHIF